MVRVQFLACAAVALLAACGGSDDSDQSGEDSKRQATPTADLPDREHLSRLGLVLGPPPNLIAACERVAQETPLTVYCPPIVPNGPVEAPKHRHENAYVYGEEQTYGLSPQSDSLIDAGTHDRLAAQHMISFELRGQE